MRIGPGRAVLAFTVILISVLLVRACDAFSNNILLSGHGTILVTNAATDSLMDSVTIPVAKLMHVSEFVKGPDAHEIDLLYPGSQLGLQLSSYGAPRAGVYTVVEDPLLKCATTDSVAHAAHSMTAMLAKDAGTVTGTFFGRSGTVTLQRVGRHGLDGTADLDMCPFSPQRQPIHVHAKFELR